MTITNKHFNRIEEGATSRYLTEYGTEGLQGSKHDGFIKCKLIHARWGTVILPDQVYLGKDASTWIQPLAFSPCILSKLEEHDIRASVYIDISCGTTIRVDFSHADLQRKCKDGSETFKCIIQGPEDLPEFSTGESRRAHDGSLELQLYHHTADDIKPRIEESAHFRGSKWNIQGTKELVNVSYVYFTCLDRITTREDLIQIAMAVDGRLHLIRDNFELPRGISRRELLDRYSDDILELKVYRDSTANRTATIKVFVSSEELASQHVFFHQPAGEPHYYEVCRPFIYRVALTPGTILPYDATSGTVRSNEPKYFGYVIAGDATSLTGLRAPYDEEHTEDIFKIEVTPEGQSLASFWFENANLDLFSNKAIEPFKFTTPSDSGKTI